MKKFYKIPNLLFKYALKPSAFALYLYLSRFPKMTMRVKFSTLAERCGMSINTAQSAAHELESKGLLHKTECYYDHMRGTNEYKLKQLGGGFSLLEKGVFDSLLTDKSALLVLCFLCKCSGAGGMAFPSLSQLSGGTRLCTTTVIRAIKHLEERKFLLKQRCICLAGDFGHNNYTLISLRARLVLIWLLNKLAPRKKSVSRPKFATRFIAKIEAVITSIKCFFGKIRGALSRFCRPENTS